MPQPESQYPTGHLGIFSRQKHLLSGLEKSGFWDNKAKLRAESCGVVGILTEVFRLSAVDWATVPELYRDILLVAFLVSSLDARGFLCPSLL